MPVAFTSSNKLWLLVYVTHPSQKLTHVFSMHDYLS